MSRRQKDGSGRSGNTASVGLPILVVLFVLPSIVACSTAQGVREKSAASMKLYADLDKAYGTYVSATGSLLQDRDRLEDIVKVAAGQKGLSFAEDAAEKKKTEQVLKALDAVGAAIGIARIEYGVVDRFLQIKVFDETEAASVSSKLESTLSAE